MQLLVICPLDGPVFEEAKILSNMQLGQLDVFFNDVFDNGSLRNDFTQVHAVMGRLLAISNTSRERWFKEDSEDGSMRKRVISTPLSRTLSDQTLLKASTIAPQVSLAPTLLAPF